VPFTKSGVVGAYRESLEMLSGASVGSTIRVFTYFLVRTQAACESIGVGSQIDVHQIRVLTKQSLMPDILVCTQLSAQFSQLAQRPDSTGERSLLVVGFWSILSYLASFLINSEIRFTHYALDVFLAGFEDALLGDPSKLLLELENLYDAMDYGKTHLEGVSEGELRTLADWAESRPLGERLRAPA